MATILSNARLIEPKYLARYFVYEDSSRQRAHVVSVYWMDERVLEDGFGTNIETRRVNVENAPLEYLTVANYPKVKMMDNPYRPGVQIPVVDVYYAPSEQWMLYQDSDEESMNRTPEFIFREEDDL